MKSPIVLTVPEYETVRIGAVTAQNDLWRPATTLAKNAHMWYAARTGVYVHTQRGNVAIGVSANTMHYSSDNGDTWTRTLAFTPALVINFCHVFESGVILWGTPTKLWRSTDNLATHAEVTPQNADGSPYTIHTPASAGLPGWYFNTFQVDNSWTVPGVGEMLAWGNYANVSGGATPINIWYSTDDGATVKVAYAFGQNPAHRDNGTAGGGATGTLLGDAENPTICRHLHGVTYHAAENAWYATTGDHNQTGPVYECHWLRGTYNSGADTWAWTVLVSASENTRYKSGGINVVNGTVYYASDATGTPDHAIGIYKCAVADILTPANHLLLSDWGYKTGKMLLHGTTLVTGAPPAVHAGQTLFLISNDLGVTWGLYDLTEVGNRSAIRFHPPNSEGWFRCDLRLPPWGMDAGEVMYFRPRPRPVT